MIEVRKNPLEYPKKDEYTTWYVYRCGELLTNGSKGYIEYILDLSFKQIKETFVRGELLASGSKGYIEYILDLSLEQIKHTFVVEEYFDKGGFDADLKDFKEEERKIVEEFKLELFAEYGIYEKEINEIVFLKAWEDSHSGGFHEVETYFEEYIQFAEDILEALAKSQNKI